MSTRPSENPGRVSYRLYIFTAAIREGYYVLAVIGVLNSAISLYYYMTIIRAMAFEMPEEGSPLTDNAMDRLYAAAFAIPTVALLYFAPVMQLIELTAR